MHGGTLSHIYREREREKRREKRVRPKREGVERKKTRRREFVLE